MFGYISINKAEMKFKDYDVYHSYYCGLCKRLKESYGRRGQITLSYDMTFLIVLLSGLYEPKTAISVTNCIAHPFEKHLTRINHFSDYAADMNLLLTYYKCEDDWQDERKKKGLLLSRMLRSDIKNIKKKYPKKVAVTASNLQKLSVLEKENEQNLDKMAGLFGEIMAELFVYSEDEWADSLRRIGFFMGKFIYLMDAYEDLEKDIESDSYNPLKDIFQKTEDQKAFADDCRHLLTLMMSECSREFEKLPILLHAEILRNVLYAGVWNRYTFVTEKRLSEHQIHNTGEYDHE